MQQPSPPTRSPPSLSSAQRWLLLSDRQGGQHSSRCGAAACLLTCVVPCMPCTPA
jgi:hypothetical protein